MPSPTEMIAARIPAPVKREVGRAIENRRIGNLSADRGLDILTFFIADVQTGFGPFIANYLTASMWTQQAIGQVLGVGSLVAVVAQVPTGALIDAIPWKRGAAMLALLSVMGSALLLAVAPRWWPSVWAEVLHGVASCLLVPAIAAISLTRVGRRGMAERLGRNARFMALGSALGAPLLGLAGSHIAPSAVFWLVAISTLPALFALLALPARHQTEPRPPRIGPKKAAVEGKRVLLDRRLLIFVGCVVLFHASNGFMLPLASSMLQVHLGGDSNLWLSACIVGPQLTVAAASPWVGRMAERYGRRRLLIVGFVMLPLRGVLLAMFGGGPAIVAIELLDGVGGAMFGVMQPLIASDITAGTNRFNLALGLLGLSAGLGGFISGNFGGWLASHFGGPAGFLGLAAVGAAATAIVWALMPETRPADASPAKPASAETAAAAE